MSYQYGSNHNTTAPDYNSLTSGGSLGIDFPPSYYSGGSNPAISSTSNFRNLTGVVSSEGFSGSQLTSRTNGLAHSNNNSSSNLLLDNQDVTAVEDVSHREHLGEDKSSDALSICSLPPYSDIKGLIHESIDITSVEICDQKPKTNVMHNKQLRNELKKTFMGELQIDMMIFSRNDSLEINLSNIITY